MFFGMLFAITVFFQRGRQFPNLLQCRSKHLNAPATQCLRTNLLHSFPSVAAFCWCFVCQSHNSTVSCVTSRVCLCVINTANFHVCRSVLENTAELWQTDTTAGWSLKQQKANDAAGRRVSRSVLHIFFPKSNKTTSHLILSAFTKYYSHYSGKTTNIPFKDLVKKKKQGETMYLDVNGAENC